MRDFTTHVAGGDYFEGLRWHRGHWYASDAFGGTVFRVEHEGARTELLEVDALCSGIGWLPDDDLLVVSLKDRTVLRHSAADGVTRVHADLSGLSEHWINDMFVDAAGRAWIGGMGFDIVNGAPPETGALYRVDPDGSAHIAAQDLWFPNGIVGTDDGSTLVVAETFAGRLTAFTVGDDGTLSGRRVLGEFGPMPDPSGGAAAMLGGLALAPDGLTIDREDHVWVADAANRRCVRVSPAGEIVDEVAAPGGVNLYSCALGGPGGDHLMLALAEGFFEAAQGVTGTASLVSTRVDVPAVEGR
ncbi:SMP-30/gluconolactonase/LRE family protein [Dietzia aurantiaca]|uniref:SMP-30/gluconolactonase/LRE family protein n=1 Tax=Dietzia aurantiaca TaxID=983873 RepID=A0ABV9PUI7_9ACTN